MYKQVWRVNKESSNPSTRKQNDEDKREESQQDQKREWRETGRKKKNQPRNIMYTTHVKSIMP